MIESPRLSISPGVSHSFFTRRGGVSEGVYASLNCGYGSDDDPGAVGENRRRVTDRLKADHLITAYQTHSATAVAVSDPWQPADAPTADALVTDRPGIALGILTADCAPILLADPEAGIVGAAHAGWKGALLGIVGATVEAMQGLGAKTERITAAVGPALAQDSYEVSAEFHRRFVDDDPGFETFFAPGPRPEKFQFDLLGFVGLRLKRAGVTRIDTIPRDTYAQETDFFSYRRCCHREEPDFGRQVSAILLRTR